ncbi:hypothetical protein M3Y99_00341900 [Aphelenchoides fujianensis]|nr:hypothetical protein M3Y99_00341900 [Aphelenchoides fujianensis]
MNWTKDGKSPCVCHSRPNLDDVNGEETYEEVVCSKATPLEILVALRSPTEKLEIKRLWLWSGYKSQISLPVGIFAKVRPSELHVSSVESIEPHAFDEIADRLMSLELHGELNQTIDFNETAKLSNLRLPSLANSKVEALDLSFFVRMPFLKTLRLPNSGIRKISAQPGDFQLKQLEELDLHSNRLKHIDHSILRALPKLKTLNLANNRIGHFASTFFDEVPELEVLKLDDNTLQNSSA